MYRFTALGVVILALVGLSFGLVKCGRDAERAEVAVEDAQAATVAAQAGAETNAVIAEQTDTFGARRVVLIQEANDAAIEIEAHAGADQLVDAGLARLLVCRVERVRGDAPAHCDAGGDRPDAIASGEPVPSWAPS